VLCEDDPSAEFCTRLVVGERYGLHLLKGIVPRHRHTSFNLPRTRVLPYRPCERLL